MIVDAFDYNKNYSFSGVFWFENEFDNRFSGTLEYSPEKGIELSLVTVSLDGKSYLFLKDYCAIQKMYGTIQYDKAAVNITLLEVMLGEKSSYYGKASASRIITGNARILISNIHLYGNRIKSFNIEYDDSFKSIFFYNTNPEEVSEIQPYIKKAIKVANASISFDVFYIHLPLYNADQLDNMLCDSYKHQKKSPMKEFKKIVEDFLKKHEHEIGIRKNSHSVIKIKRKSFDIQKYIEVENRWRSFFELIIDKPIVISKAWISIEDTLADGTKYASQKALLFQQYPIPTHKGANWHKYHLPITIDSFLGKNDLSKLQEPYEKWNQLYEDKKWKIIINGIKSIIYNNKLIGNEDFIILISYIETVLNILGYKTNNIDQLILKYADKKWKSEVNNLLKTLPKKGTLGKKISELRNSIAHPKSAEKENGKYFAIITDEILMQKIYGYMAGLFIKMVLLHLYNFNKENLEKYIERFIQARSGITKVKYNKNYTTYQKNLKKESNKQESEHLSSKKGKNNEA